MSRRVMVSPRMNGSGWRDGRLGHHRHVEAAYRESTREPECRSPSPPRPPTGSDNNLAHLGACRGGLFRPKNLAKNLVPPYRRISASATPSSSRHERLRDQSLAHLCGQHVDS
jgi:hypothetical protein